MLGIFCIVFFFFFCRAWYLLKFYVDARNMITGETVLLRRNPSSSRRVLSAVAVPSVDVQETNVVFGSLVVSFFGKCGVMRWKSLGFMSSCVHASVVDRDKGRSVGLEVHDMWMLHARETGAVEKVFFCVNLPLDRLEGDPLFDSSCMCFIRVNSGPAFFFLLSTDYSRRNHSRQPCQPKP